MEYKNVALIGAGAIGAYFVYGMSDLEGLSFCVVAEGERRERLIRDGITINDKVYRPVIKTPEEARGADLIFVCTKYDGIFSTLPMLENMVEDHTVVLSLLNGIDKEEIIADRIGQEHLIYSVMRIQSERRDGKIRFNPETTIGVTIGEKNKEVSDRLQALYDLMVRANLHVFISEDIVKDQWTKFINNIIYNLPQAIFGVGFGAYYDSEYMASIRDRLFEEVNQVAAAEGLPPLPMADWRKACVPKARFSTLQDIDAGRHTEVDMFTGILIKLARKHHIQVPFCEYTHAAVKLLEQKGDGLFNYNT